MDRSGQKKNKLASLNSIYTQMSPQAYFGESKGEGDDWGEARWLSMLLVARCTLIFSADEIVEVTEYECAFSLLACFRGVPPGERCTSSLRRALKRELEASSTEDDVEVLSLNVCDRFSLMLLRSLSETTGWLVFEEVCSGGRMV